MLTDRELCVKLPIDQIDTINKPVINRELKYLIVINKNPNSMIKKIVQVVYNAHKKLRYHDNFKKCRGKLAGAIFQVDFLKGHSRCMFLMRSNLKTITSFSTKQYRKKNKTLNFQPNFVSPKSINF